METIKYNGKYSPTRTDSVEYLDQNREGCAVIECIA